MKVSTIALLPFFFLVISCGQQTQATEEKEISKYPATFVKGLEAHGGLEKWNSYGTLTFTELNEKDTTKYLVDLRNRNELIEKVGKYKVGFTSDSISIYPNKESFQSDNPKFIHNLRFYFFAMPFVTADQGAFQEELEPAILNGSTYNRIKITFGEGVGIAPKDQYILWFNQSDNMLELINYSVTYFDESRAEQYNAIVFKKWKEIDGLKMPTEMIGYKWEDNTLGEERYRKYFDEISFQKEQPAPSVFTNLSK